MTTGDACGVDFGTSNSTVGCMQGGQAALLALEGDKPSLPSVVFFNAEDEQVSYGKAALDAYLAGYEGRLMRSMKSLLGTSLIDGQTEVLGRALPFRALLAYFIGELKKRAENNAGREFTQAVFGRPVFFIDDDSAADQLAQQTLAEIAQSVGFRDISFQYEPIAAALSYEVNISREELVLVVDIGGGTSDFSLLRLSPERARKHDRQTDILGSGGVHIGGTDFDKYLSLGHVMPLLGYGGKLANHADVPSGYYFNLATWHTINLNYTQKIWRELNDVYRDIKAPEMRERFERLLHLTEQRDGHWLALQAEAAKISLSERDAVSVPLERLRARSGAACTLHLQQDAFLDSVSHLIARVESALQKVLQQAQITPEQIDTIYFTGGASGVRGLRQRLGALLPGAQKVEGDLFGSIGTGLGIHAWRRYA